MQTLWQDLRYGARMLRANPGFTMVAVLSLALGIGANTAIFSVVNAALLRPLPVDEPQQLVFAFNGNRTSPYSTSSYPDYLDYRDRNEVFSGMLAYGTISVSLNGGDGAELASGAIVSGNYFELLGVRAAPGRAITPEDDQKPNAHPVVVLSHRLWQRRFGGDPGIVGRQLLLNGHSFTVIGVAPAGFEGAEVFETTDLYVPMMMQAVVRPPRGGFSGDMNPDLLARRDPRWLRLLSRLKPGVTFEQAQANLTTLAAQLEQAYPRENTGIMATLYPVSKIDPRAYPQLLGVATLLLAVVGMVLLIACANVANLLLARATARRTREIGVRMALGAQRGDVLRLMLQDGMALVAVGLGVGWAAAAALARLLTGFLYGIGPLDGATFAAIPLLLAAVALAATRLPARRATRVDPILALKHE